MNTYTRGYELNFSRLVTTHDFVWLCGLLNKLFNEKFNTNEYCFEPEPITEGGIIFKNWPNKTSEQYKSFRFGPRNDNMGKWPKIEEDVLQKWKTTQPVVVFTGGNTPTTLKAFDTAPSWTIEELKLFEKALETIGVRREGNYPDAESLLPHQDG